MAALYTAEFYSGNRRKRYGHQMKKLFRRLMSSRLRNNPAHIRLDKIAGKDLLDIGPGKHFHEDFISVDFNWRGGLDICWDITTGLPLDDACVSGVYSEHCIEHIPLESGDLVLAEMFRVLKPGGRVRIVMPDAEIYLTRYVNALKDPSGEPMPYAERDDFHGIYQPIMSVNRIFHEHGHRFIYDFPMLKSLLERHHFANIELCSFGEGKDPRLVKDSSKRARESFYVEAEKPQV